MNKNKAKEYDVKIQRTKQLAIKAEQILKEYSSKIKKEKIEALSYFRKIKDVCNLLYIYTTKWPIQTR